MSKVTFEDFLMTQHANQYVGTKDMLVDDFPGWLTHLCADELIEYGDMFAKEQSKGLVEVCKEAFKTLHGNPNVPAQLCVDLKQAIQKTEEGK